MGIIGLMTRAISTTPQGGCQAGACGGHSRLLYMLAVAPPERRRRAPDNQQTVGQH